MEPAYEGTKRAPMRGKGGPHLIEESAVRSLENRLEQKLTMHRLGPFQRLGRSLKIINCIESIMALIGRRKEKVACWRKTTRSSDDWRQGFWI